jgi:hypothetical protein
MNPLNATLYARLLRRPPILRALLSLVISMVLVGATTAALLSHYGTQPDALIILGGIGLLSAVIGHQLMLAKWWIPILILFPSALGASLGASLRFDVPSWIYLACFTTLLIVYWNAAGDRVPLFLSNAQTCAAIDTVIQNNTKSFIDIGCGVGSVLVYLGRRHPEIHFTGIETAPIPFLISKLRVLVGGMTNVSIHFQNMWSSNLQQFDIVYCFLSPEPMIKLFDKVETEMRPGTLFVSNSFIVPGHASDDVIDVGDVRQTKLLIWRR